MNRYYFTFGYGQYLLSGKSAANCYVVVCAEDEMQARTLMYAYYGRKWSMCYNSAEEAGVDKYNLKEVELGD